MKGRVLKNAHVTAVSKSKNHSFSKHNCDSITLLAGHGVEGDAHSGTTVKHRSRVAVDPSQPNLRQVHLIHAELHDELTKQGFQVVPGVMGENITTRGVDILGLPRDTLMYIGDDVIIQVTGLRNPCKQLDNYQNGLLKAVLGNTADGEVIRKAGIMGIVRAGGVITSGDTIKLKLPDKPHHKLERV